MKIRFDAHDYCLDIGGYLVEIDTKEEEDWLLGAFAVYDQVGFCTKLSFFRCNSISSTYHLFDNHAESRDNCPEPGAF